MKNAYPHAYRTKTAALFQAALASENCAKGVSVVYSSTQMVRLDSGRYVPGAWSVCRGYKVGAHAIFYKSYLVWSDDPADRVQKYWPQQPSTLQGIYDLLDKEGAL